MKTPTYVWQPTTAEIAVAAGIPESEVERFDHNTSPFPTPWATSVVAAPSSRLNEYPAASYAAIRTAVATYTGMEAENVIPGAGADELILLAGRAFLSPGSSAIQIAPTYPLYEIATAQAGATLTTIETEGPDFDPQPPQVREAARYADVTWLCMPNNPTGGRLDDNGLRSILDSARGVVVLDAAYAEFAGDDWTGWVAEHDNLLVLHTFSKAFGLAGARVGYGLGHPDLVSAIDRLRPPGSITSLSVDLAIAALTRPDRMHGTVADLASGRRKLAGLLGEVGFRALPGATNFVLCEVGPKAMSLHKALMRQGLVVRNYPESNPLAEYLRFTVRSSEAHRRLIAAIEKAR